MLYLIRHAHAVDAAEDSVRPLSKRGRAQIRVVTIFLTASGSLDAGEFWHSPLARSRQTAAQLVKRLDLDARLLEVSGLQGEDDPAIIARRLESRKLPLAIVGHEPHLSALASLLVSGAADPPRFVLKKCAVLALERLEDHWMVRWQVAPEILPRRVKA